jgi:1,4-dihydroxy-2-naphthoyl-CoA hydrolase
VKRPVPTGNLYAMESAQVTVSDDDIGAAGSLGVRMGITFLEASPERVVGTMPVEGNTQPYGLLHGGASCVLAESLGSVGAAMHAAQLHGGIAVGVDINATHHKGVRDGIVTGVATPIRLGATIASYEIVITDEVGERVCTARLTCAILRASR